MRMAISFLVISSMFRPQGIAISNTDIGRADGDFRQTTHRFTLVFSWTNLTGMKKLIGLACAVLILSGCHKENAGLESSGMSVNAKSSARLWMCFDCDQNGQNCADCSCYMIGGNCLPDLPVSRIHQSAVDEVFIAIKSKSPSKIIDAFTAHRSVLVNYIDEVEVDKVISGTFKATTEPGKRGAQFIVVREQDETVVMAYEMFSE